MALMDNTLFGMVDKVQIARGRVNPEYKSKVYTDRPAYADFDAPAKFMAIQSIIAKRLVQYPNAICSYSGGSDSDIMLHMIETVRKMLNLPPIHYCFFNTGLHARFMKRWGIMEPATKVQWIELHAKSIERRWGI